MKHIKLFTLCAIATLAIGGCGKGESTEEAAVNKDVSKTGETMPAKMQGGESAGGGGGGTPAAPVQVETAP